jgi:hypothetical protein
VLLLSNLKTPKLYIQDMKKLIISAITILSILAFKACKKGEEGGNNNTPPPNPCAGVTVTVATTKFDAIIGQNNGSITVTNPVGSGITYKLNTGAFQASTNFNNLTAGSYAVTARTAAGCEGSTNVSIVGYGPQYYAVKELIMGYCGPCHLGGGSSGGVNFNTDADIVNRWDRIRARCVDGSPSFMPQGGQLTAVDKAKITAWIAGGRTTTN